MEKIEVLRKKVNGIKAPISFNEKINCLITIETYRKQAIELNANEIINKLDNLEHSIKFDCGTHYYNL